MVLLWCLVFGLLESILRNLFDPLTLVNQIAAQIPSSLLFRRTARGMRCPRQTNARLFCMFLKECELLVNLDKSPLQQQLKINKAIESPQSLVGCANLSSAIVAPIFHSNESNE